MGFEAVELTVDDGVAHLRLNRPRQANALNEEAWEEFSRAFRDIDANPAARVAVVSGSGAHFCSGIDLELLGSLTDMSSDSPGHAAEALHAWIADLQAALGWAEKCRVPVIAAMHGACFGAGVDLAAACDLRYASHDAVFAIKEIDMGITADVGVLQRLPRIIGDGATRELAYTGRAVSASEAHALGLVNRVFRSPTELLEQVLALAGELAAKSSLALRGTKRAITYARDHSIQDGLEQVALWNAATLRSADLTEALAAFQQKRPAHFPDR